MNVVPFSKSIDENMYPVVSFFFLAETARVPSSACHLQLKLLRISLGMILLSYRVIPAQSPFRHLVVHIRRADGTVGGVLLV